MVQVATYTPQKDFVEDPGSIVLLNGELDLHILELKPFNPDHHHKNRLPVKYDENAVCPNFERFMNEVLPGENPEVPSDDVLTIQEEFGYCLIKTSKFEIAFVYQGVGDNGKTKLLNVLNALLGPENVSHESLYDISATRWSKAELYHRSANTAADISSDEIQRTGTFKMLTGTDPVTAERKNQNKFSFINYAKLFFSCNLMPTTPDKSYAFFKRFIVHKFLRIFVRGVDMDEDILLKLTTPEELSGILNWAITGLKRLLTNRDFTKRMTPDETKELMEKMADPISAYIQDCLNPEDPEGVMVKADTYRAYRQYCKKFGYVPESDKKLYSEIRAQLTVQDTQIRIGDSRPPVFKGFKLRCKGCGKCPGVKAVNGVKGSLTSPLLSIDDFSHVGDTSLDTVDGSVKDPKDSAPSAPPPKMDGPPPEDHTCEVCGAPASFRYAGRWLCKKHLDEMIRADHDMGGAAP